MKLIGIGQTDNSINLRYESTFRQGWQHIMCFMQVFVDDLQKDTESVHYFAIAGAKPETVTIPEQKLLHKADLLQEERGGLVISGNSTIMEFNIKLTTYNQTNIIDVEIPKTDELLDKFTKDNHTLDRYMSSLELNGRSIYSQKYAIEMFADALARKDDETVMKKFLDYCEKIGATPFPDKK